MQVILTNLILLIGLVNCLIWLGISALLLYNLWVYTKDKYGMRQLIHPEWRKYFPW